MRERGGGGGGRILRTMGKCTSPHLFLYGGLTEEDGQLRSLVIYKSTSVKRAFTAEKGMKP